MPVFQEFSLETTFHGPNHAVATRSRPEKVFWFSLFIVSVAVAAWQSSILVMSYVNDTSNMVKQEREVSTELLADVHYFKVCPEIWLDRRKIRKEVKEGRLSYKSLLFALAALPTVNDALLSDMATWWEIFDEERIWRLQRCKPDSQKTVLPEDVKLKAKKRFSNLVESGKTFFSGFGNLEAVAAIQQGKEALKSLKERIQQECNSGCAPIFIIGDWKNQAELFFNKTNGKYGTLTSFFAEIAEEFNPIIDLGGKHVKYEFTNGRMCQVTSLGASEIVKGAAAVRVPLAEDIDDLIGGQWFIGLKRAQVEIIPYSTESSYEAESSSDDKYGGLQPNLLFQAIFKGLTTSVNVKVPEMQKIVRKQFCTHQDTMLRVPDGYGISKCKTECKKRYEEVVGAPENFRVVTGNDFGDIPLDRQLAPARFLNVTVGMEAASKCMAEQHCDELHYCEEWRIQSKTTVEQKAPEYDPTSCSSVIGQLLTSLMVKLDVGRGHEIYFTQRLSGFDVLGIIGGLLGFYIGCSAITLIHCVVFGLKRVAKSCQGKKLEVDDGGDRGSIDN